MAFFRCGGSGIPASLKSGMNSVLNKKFGTSTTYDPAGWPADVNLLGPLPVKSVSGAIASFSDGADGVPVKSCVVSFLPSGGGGTPSAPVAIQGVSGVSVTRTGKNLFDGFTKGYRVNASTGAIEENVNGAISGYIPVRESTAYYISGLTNTIHSFIAYYKADKTYISRTSGNNKTYASLTTPSECTYAVVCQYISNDSGTLDDLDNLQTQLELGSSATTYSAYVTPSVVTDTFGQTIYGGSRDLTTDKASVTWGYHKVTSSDGIYAYATGNGFRVSTNTSTWTDGIMKGQTNCGGVCNAFVKVTDNNSTGIRFSIGDNTSIYFVNVYDVVGSTVENFKSYLDNHDIYVAYELSNPTEITGLTPHEIDTLYGDNNIYADTGTTTVEYRADIDLALNP